nr:serine carboxypeptidase-like 45 [Quercus suber]
MIQSQQQWMVMAIICASLVQIFMAVESVPIEDKITSLPGQPQVSFQQFSGYITIDETQERALFYYFVEAEAQPDSKPLVLWLNGEANILYLESPAGVGFSYSANKSFYNYVNDEIAGHYVPQLAHLIIQSKVKFNLKGIAVSITWRYDFKKT